MPLPFPVTSRRARRDGVKPGETLSGVNEPVTLPMALEPPRALRPRASLQPSHGAWRRQAPLWGLAALGLWLAALTGIVLADAPAGERGLLLLLLLTGVWAMAGLLLQHLLRQLRRAAQAMRRFAQQLRHDDLLPAVQALHADAGGLPLLRQAASDVELALGERERRWKARVFLSGDWHWETDEQARLCWVSEDLASHLKLGLEPAELLARRFDEVPSFVAPERGWAAFGERMQQRKSFRDVEIEVRRPGRSPVWVALNGRARRDDEGRFIGYEGVGRDITEQRLAYRRLYASERRYAVMAELSADWYWETDEHHRFTLLGPMLADVLGEAGALQFRGRTRWEAYPDGASVEQWAAHRAALQAHLPFAAFEYTVRVPGRSVTWVSVSGQPRRDDKACFVGYQGVGRDITLSKQAQKLLLERNARLEEQVAERTAELERHNRDLEAFSRQLAHELRTPISHVVGLTDLLRARAWERLAADEREWLTLQGRAAREMSHTVTALLELARSGSAPLVREAVDLSALARVVIEQLPWVERQTPIEWQIEPGLRAECSAPLARVVLMNLLGNAAKFTRDATLPLVRLADDGQPNGFVVQDNGAGFDAVSASRLFQPFVRLHGGDQFPGTGLGLSIVRRIVERHGGAVRASASPGGGARFHFSFSAGAGESTDDAVQQPP